MIVKTKKGYVLYSRKKTKGRRRKLGGPYKSRIAALRRERQVNYWKHKMKGG